MPTLRVLVSGLTAIVPHKKFGDATILCPHVNDGLDHGIESHSPVVAFLKQNLSGDHPAGAMEGEVDGQELLWVPSDRRELRLTSRVVREGYIRGEQWLGPLGKVDADLATKEIPDHRVNFRAVFRFDRARGCDLIREDPETRRVSMFEFRGPSSGNLPKPRPLVGGVMFEFEISDDPIKIKLYDLDRKRGHVVFSLKPTEVSSSVDMIVTNASCEDKIQKDDDDKHFVAYHHLSVEKNSYYPVATKKSSVIPVHHRSHSVFFMPKRREDDIDHWRPCDKDRLGPPLCSKGLFDPLKV
jgi:hypothetical protein